MFFKKLFSKSLEQILWKADSLFKDERYSEARQFYIDALEKIRNTSGEQQNLVYIDTMISKCGNSLAEMNICEAEAAISSGNTQKAAEYLELSLELADDVSLREKAENLISSLAEFPPSESKKSAHAGKHGCSSCEPAHHSTSPLDLIQLDHLHTDEQFLLLVNTLPGDLPQRYVSLGEEFASAYLLANSDESGEALNKFRQLLSAGDNDIILYETALLEYKEGRIELCESLLGRALTVNADNPVCNLSLAQLFAETGRLNEAVVLLKSMMERTILFEQSLIMLADVYTMKGEQESAITLLSSGIQLPLLKKASAERLVPILSSQGRDVEAAFLIKTYLKGCC
jgi:tetratricopeptide (TPR) repeat protein